MCINHPGGTGFEGIKISWRAFGAWHCEGLWKAIGESVASLAIGNQELKGSCREIEVWHHGESL